MPSPCQRTLFEFNRGGSAEADQLKSPQSTILICKVISGDRVSPDNVIGVAQVEPLLTLGSIVDHTHSSNEVDYLTRGSVVEVVATLVSTVTVHPLQAELALRGCFVGHGSILDLICSWSLRFSPLSLRISLVV